MSGHKRAIIQANAEKIREFNRMAQIVADTQDGIAEQMEGYQAQLNQRRR